MDRRAEIIKRLLAADDAKNDILAYTRFTMPDSTDPAPNPRTRYITGRHHEFLARQLMRLEQGHAKRLIVNIGPRHGKTELASKRFIAWYSGRHPQKSMIFGTYNNDFAADVGREVKANIQAPEHQLVFPKHELRDDSQASNRLRTKEGGQLSFVGRGGTITGRGGDGIIIDDPIKDRKEADSPTIRKDLWEWFTQVIGTRRMTEDAWVMLIQTRWHEDDLVGRLTDPMNPFYDPDEAAQWEVVDLPAIALENDVLHRKEGEPLWPERFSLSYLKQQQRLDPRGFQALYQGRPSAATGNFFLAEWVKTYKQDELPKNLRFYIASDHAVSTLKGRDKTAMIPVGVDENDNIFVLPTVQWGQFAADDAVERMLNLMRLHKPMFWWAERGHISKAIGPFLRKRMSEEGVYAAIVELTPSANKETRAQSIQGRMAMGKVFFPSFAPWWPEARDQILKFPHGANDDFVDALAYIGLGLTQQVAATPTATSKGYGRPGTFRHMFQTIREQARRDASNNSGF